MKKQQKLHKKAQRKYGIELERRASTQKQRTAIQH